MASIFKYKSKEFLNVIYRIPAVPTGATGICTFQTFFREKHRILLKFFFMKSVILLIFLILNEYGIYMASGM